MFMIKRLLLTALCFFPLPGGGQLCAQNDKLQQAADLYRSGLYERAARILEEVEPSDALSDGYLTLCRVKTRTEGWIESVEKYDRLWQESSLRSRIHNAAALNLFDDLSYAAASDLFASVNVKHLESGEVPEYTFKRAYCDFSRGLYDSARAGMADVVALPYSDYTAPAQYTIGYIDYSARRFAEAEDWLTKSASDSRFTSIAAYYILECRFMRSDYDYVMQHGDEVYASVPEERKAHLARILSEAFLVSGDTAKAKEYYDRDLSGAGLKSGKDLFYAGSVSYASQDWQGAIDSFSAMPSRTDSLGQIASYQLADAYLKTRNKVAALGAFKEAAQLSWDTDIQEDAFFNYAKLAFDINRDSAPFEQYLSRWADSRRGDAVYSYIAVAYLYNRDYEAAVAAYDKIDELNPQMRGNYMKANYLRALQLISGGSWRDAVDCLRAASFYTGKNDPFNQMSRYWLAQAYYRTADYARAADIFTDLYNLSALEGQAEGATIPYDLAYTYFTSGDYASAAKWFDKYCASDAKEFRSDALVRRADCDFIRKDYSSAISAYEKALSESRSADNVYPYYQLGLAYGLTGRIDKKIEALSTVEEADAAAPLYCDALYELGRSYVDAGKDERATQCFEKLRSTSRDSSFVARALIELGMVSRNASDYDKALGYYKEVAATMKGSEYYDDALAAIESIYQAKGEPEAYFAYLDRSGISSGKTGAEKEAVYFNSAEQVFLSGNYAKALVSLQKYLDAYPDGSKAANAQFYLAESYRALGRKEEACDSYAQVISSAESGSFTEISLLQYAALSYALAHYSDAYRGYASLLESARLEDNVFAAKTGMLRSSFRARLYDKAIAAGEALKADSRCTEELGREADYVKAKSLLGTSRRSEAFGILNTLSANPSDSYGAEAAYLLIQDIYDRGEFDKVESRVYSFAQNAPDQSYWLAKAFIVLGDSFAEKDNMTQAEATFRSIEEGYVPSGDGDDVLDNVRIRLGKIAELKK